MFTGGHSLHDHCNLLGRVWRFGVWLVSVDTLSVCVCVIEAKDQNVLVSRGNLEISQNYFNFYINEDKIPYVDMSCYVTCEVVRWLRFSFHQLSLRL
jgi:hypothetical protein